MILDAKTLKEYIVNVGVTQGSIFGAAPFYYRLMTFLMLSVILLSVVEHYYQCDQASD